MWYSYLFEAKAIQSYILGGGRLRHTVGGSAIVHELCSDGAAEGAGKAGALDKALELSGLGQVSFMRRAGGAFSFAFEADVEDRLPASLQAFQRLWTFAVQTIAPGLSFVDAVGRGAGIQTATADAWQSMAGRRGFPSFALPLATPPMLRAPRTGEPAVGSNREDVLDRALEAKEAKRNSIVARNGPGDTLASRFKEGTTAGDWPQDMDDDFPFAGEDRTVAILHADGNRMGELVQALGNRLEAAAGIEYARAFRAFSDEVDKATEASVRAAGDSLVKSEKTGKFPARPILCAGDELTIILRADIALDFAVRFLETFESECSGIIERLDLPGSRIASFNAVTACGALVFCNANHPFIDVHRLAESACKFAKAQAKSFAPDPLDKVPSCLTIHRVTGSLTSDYEDIVERELTAKVGGGTSDPVVLTANPYLVKRQDSVRLPCIDDLKALAASIGADPDDGERIGAGVFRELASLSYLAPTEAARRVDRIVERVAKGTHRQNWHDFEAAYRRLLASLGMSENQGKFVLSFNGVSPLNDAVMLSQINRRAAA